MPDGVIDRWFFKCRKCGENYDLNSFKHRCQCGGLFGLAPEDDGILNLEPSISLGEVVTPLIKAGEREIYYKLDYYHPTGSFKDRGARVLISLLKYMGIKKIKEDSSGNAGAAIAAYAAAAEIDCKIFVPASASGGKIRQIEAYGAGVEKIEGSREKVHDVALSREKGRYYASHIYNPLFFAGVSTLVQELINQLPGPDELDRGSIIVPVGNGTFLLGLTRGLKEAGLNPQIIAVQSEDCCPVFNEFYSSSSQEAGGNDITKKDRTMPESKENSGCGRNSGKKPAEGIMIEDPPRLEGIISAVRNFSGSVIKVSDLEINHALSELHKKGIYVESTAAAAPAALKKIEENKSMDLSSPVIIPLTGSGLKEGW